MDREALKGLEFYKVIEEIARYCHSDSTRELISSVSPFDDIDSILKRFGQIREIMRLMDEGSRLSFCDFHDISGIIYKVRPEDSALDPLDLLLLLPVLRLIEEVSEVLNGKGLVFLRPLSEGLSGFPHIKTKIEKTIDSEGNILDSASPALAELRNKKRSLEKRIKKRLEELIMDKRIAPFLQDSFISMRSGRWVIPVRMDSKGEVKGIVHDVSRSGDTAFIEPVEIIGISNELENTIAEEKVEELRILREISRLIRAEADEIGRQFNILVTIDLLNSIALFSESIKARIPDINKSGLLRLHEARHPILLISKREDEVVPLSIEVGKSEKVMVITGPNAGGKTVAVKTVGLLTAMALSGIPIPASQSSSIPLVKNIYVDIGDEQSIVDNISTFSGHIRRISDILSKVRAEDMVIIDELGTGTEPSQGAALGCAILEELRDRGAIVFATTHLIDIVGFVYSSPGMINASMEFDRRTLSPLYRLKVGEPGESHAFEIARRYGLPDGIIERARLRFGKGADLHTLLNELRDRKDNYERLLREEALRIERLKEQEKRLKEVLGETERERREIIKKAYEEAREIVIDFRGRLNKMMEEIKVKGVKVLAKEVAGLYKEVETSLKGLSGEPEMDVNEIRPGESVFVRSIGEDAVVTKVMREKGIIKVRIRNMEVEVPLEEVSRPKGTVRPTKVVSLDVREGVERELNIMGLRVDEGIRRLESFLNHAFLSGLREVRVVHGIGKGLLLKAVRRHLEGHPLVEDFRPEEEKGRNGVTLIRIVSRS